MGDCILFSNTLVVFSVSDDGAAQEEANTISAETGELGPEGVVGEHGGTRASLDKVIVENTSEDIERDDNGEDDETDGTSRKLVVVLNDARASRDVTQVEEGSGHARIPSDSDVGLTSDLAVASNRDDRAEGSLTSELLISSDILQSNTASRHGLSSEGVATGSEVLTEAVRSVGRSGRRSNRRSSRGRMHNEREGRANSGIVLVRSSIEASRLRRLIRVGASIGKAQLTADGHLEGESSIRVVIGITIGRSGCEGSPISRVRDGTRERHCIWRN